MSRIVLISTAKSATQATKLQITKGNRATGYKEQYLEMRKRWPEKNLTWPQIFPFFRLD